MQKKREYDAANHDFTIRHFLQNSTNSSSANIHQSDNTTKPIQHLWNTATSVPNMHYNDKLSKSCSEPTISSRAVLEATKSFKQMPTIDSEHICANRQQTSNDCDTDHVPEYTQEAGKQIVSQFANRFPTFKPKLMKQFPKEWLNVQNTEQGKASGTNQLFQFSHLERGERERLIQELFEYGPIHN